MANEIFNSVREFNAAASTASNELKKATRSPFYCVNELNKLAKKNAYLDKEALAPVAAAVRKLHGERYSFSLCIFPKDSLGRYYFAAVKPASVSEADVVSVSCGEVVLDAKGRELVIDAKGEMKALEYSCTTESLFAHFKRAAAAELRQAIEAKKAEQRAEAEAAKAAKKAAKRMESKVKELSLKYTKGEISEFEFAERMSELKAA